MSTYSGTSVFNLDVDDIIEQALEPLGGEEKSGIEMSKARRVLNLLLIQLSNKDIPLHKLDTVSQVLTSGNSSYVLDTSIEDVLECNCSVSSVAIPMERYGEKKYHQIPKKTQAGRPTVFTTYRLRDAVTLKVWPVPNNAATYTAEMLVYKKIEDVNASYQKLDLPTRYLPLMIKWLSYELALTRPNPDPNFIAKIQVLKADRDEVLGDTEVEDRERADINIELGGISGF